MYSHFDFPRFRPGLVPLVIPKHRGRLLIGGSGRRKPVDELRLLFDKGDRLIIYVFPGRIECRNKIRNNKCDEI